MDGEAFGREVVEIVRSYIEREVEPIRAENEQMKARIAELENRKPEKGDPGDKGDPGESGADGKDADPEAVRQIIIEEIAKAVAELPPPEKGEKGDPGEKGEPGNDGNPGEPGRDGRGVKDLLIDRDGQLVATMDDGEMKNLGPVVGRDGSPGAPGKDGRDGFSLDSFDVQATNERTIELIFEQGDRREIYELAFPVIIDQGVYRAGEKYVRGDAVTWGGSLWIAQKDTDAKPDSQDSGWRLAVKRGRDGKDAKNG